MRMTRRVTFSSGHRYWLASLDERQNRELFGRFGSPYSHGHNYVLDVTVAGDVDPSTGMVVNIKRVDDVLKETVLSVFDGKSINDEITYFRERPPSVENLMEFIRGQLIGDSKSNQFGVSSLIGGDVDAAVNLVHLRLEETPTFYGEYDLLQTSMTITRIYEFAAAHRLHSFELTEAENRSLYGKCNNLAGHGHNYVLEVTVTGTPDPVTGMIADLTALDLAVESLVIDRFDHKNLDQDVPELSGRITTSENVAQTIFDILDRGLTLSLTRVRLWETARNMFEVTAST